MIIIGTFRWSIITATKMLHENGVVWYVKILAQALWRVPFAALYWILFKLSEGMAWMSDRAGDAGYWCMNLCGQGGETTNDTGRT